MAEQALRRVRDEQLQMRDNLKVWYQGLDEALHNKDQYMKNLESEVKTLRERLKVAETSANEWRVKYLNVEANHLYLKTNLAAERGSCVMSPIHDLIHGPAPNLKEPGLKDREAAEEKRSPYNRDAFKRIFGKKVPAKADKRCCSKKTAKTSASEPFSRWRNPAPQRQLRDAVRKAYSEDVKTYSSFRK